MAEVKKIQCPSCGSNSAYKLVDGNYKCNYCQSNFLVNERQQTINKEKVNPPIEAVSPSKNNSKIILAVAMGFIVFFCVGLGSFFLSSSSHDNETSVFTKESTPPSIQMTHAFVGKNGAVIWIISENNSLKDSVYYQLQIIDPLTKSAKQNLTIVPAFKVNGNTNFNKKINTQFWQYDDLAYNISEENGFVAYNIYTGIVELNNQLLTQKYDVLKGGILKIERSPSENRFVITTTNGDIFKFNPYMKDIEINSARDNKEEQITSELYLSDGLKHQLYLFTKKGSGFPILMGKFVEESYFKSATKAKGANVKDIFGNINLEKVSDKNYFRADPMLKDKDGNLVVMYKTDLSEKASVIVESVSITGKTNWMLEDSLLQKTQKAFSSDDLEANYIYSQSILVIVIPSDEHKYIGVNIATGKKLWDFNCKKYLADSWKLNNPN